MSNKPRLLSVVQFDRDPYASSRARERDLNAAIIQAEISDSFEQYLEIFDVFYDEDETHSEWTLELIGVSGRSCSLSWRALRKWSGSRVVYEHHYDHQQSGGPLTSDDLSLNADTSAARFRGPS